jgi:hypothetical protein
MSERNPAVDAERPTHRRWLGFLMAAWVASFWQMLVTGDVPYYRDLLRTYYPLRTYMAERLRSWALPEWYPFENLGEPFIGQVVTGVFHPLSLLYVVVDPVLALRLEILLCYLLAWIGALLNLRAMGLSWRATATGVLAYGLSGYALAMSNNLPYLRGFAALPWLAWGVQRLARTRTPMIAVPGAAICWALILMGGDLQSYLLGALVALCVLVSAGSLRRIGWLILSGILSACLAACELLPAWVARSQSIRTGATTAAIGQDWALYPMRLPELFVSGWIPAEVRSLFVHEILGGGTAVWATSIFMGSGTLFLAASAIVQRRAARPWLLLALFGAWMALGWYGALHTILRQVIPLLDSFRFPEKYLLVTCLGVSVAAANGAEGMQGSNCSRAARVLAAVASGLLVGGAGIRFTNVWVGLVPATLSSELAGPLISEIRSAWSLGALKSSIALAALALVLWRSINRPLLLGAIPLIVGLELGEAARGLIPLVPPAALREPPSLCQAARAEGAGLGSARLFPAARYFPPSAMGAAEAPLWVKGMRNLMEPDVGGLCEVETLGYNLPALPARVRVLLGFKAAGAKRYLSLFNVPFVISDRVPPEGTTPVQTLPELEYVLSKQPASPRAYAAAPRFVGTEEQALRSVSADPTQAQSRPILEGPPPYPFESDDPRKAGTVHLVAYEPERVELDVSLEHPAAVILNDSNYPGWSATVDGSAAQIYPANYLVRGVLVPAGRHVLEFRFAMPGLRLGLDLSALALVACLILLLISFRRRPLGPDTQ